MSLVDLHVHGAFGVDVVEAGPAEMDRMALGLAARGVTAFLPTLVPLPLDAMTASLARLSAWMAARREGDGRGALPLGLHLEGPFVSPSRTGALHPDCFLTGEERSAAPFFERLDGAGLTGRHMVTLAPEIPGGVALVREFVRRGFTVSIGHTDAGPSTLDEALRAGARHVTHFCNAMRPLHHRDVGTVGWGLLRDDVTVDVIADLEHLSPEMLRLVLRVKDPSRVALISDAIPAAGLADGDYAVWGETLFVRGGVARNAAGSLAGSTRLLDEGVANLVSLGIPRLTALACASQVPLRVLAS